MLKRGWAKRGSRIIHQWFADSFREVDWSLSTKILESEHVQFKKNPTLNRQPVKSISDEVSDTGWFWLPGNDPCGWAEYRLKLREQIIGEFARLALQKSKRKWINARTRVCTEPGVRDLLRMRICLRWYWQSRTIFATCGWKERSELIMTPRSRTVEEMSIFDPAISSGPAGHFFTLPEVPSQMISVLAVLRQS